MNTRPSLLLLLLTSCGSSTPTASAPPAAETPGGPGAVAGEGAAAATPTAVPSPAQAESKNPESSNAAASAADPTTAAKTKHSSGVTTAAPSRCPAGMVLVPGGKFKRTGGEAESVIPDLCVDVLETSAEEYKACVAAGKCTTSGLDCSAQATWNKADKANHPIVCVEFQQATAYCSHLGKRLPTTDEWEWVARGGNEARTYPWGNEEPNDQLCWTGKKAQTETCEVGSFPAGASKHGVKNMGGNVLEFTTTDADKFSPVRIARGGAWNGGDKALFRNSRLGGFKIDYRCGFLGIRCFMDAPPPKKDPYATRSSEK